VVNDEVYVGRLIWHLVVEDGAWELALVDTLDEWIGASACPLM